ILELQPDFKVQKFLIQEVIKNAGHLCIFLPKFHCELNFIEFFWGKAKKYLHDPCDYTFQTLKENLPHALASRQSECGNIRCLSGWRLIALGWTQRITGAGQKIQLYSVPPLLDTQWQVVICCRHNTNLQNLSTEKYGVGSKVSDDVQSVGLK
ncbi:hypothetical protein PAXRUDRAFT_792738, partial [Paxillus rubicundulus Ve08.2h10]